MGVQCYLVNTHLCYVHLRARSCVKERILLFLHRRLKAAERPISVERGETKTKTYPIAMLGPINILSRRLLCPSSSQTTIFPASADMIHVPTSSQNDSFFCLTSRNDAFLCAYLVFLSISATHDGKTSLMVDLQSFDEPNATRCFRALGAALLDAPTSLTEAAGAATTKAASSSASAGQTSTTSEGGVSLFILSGFLLPWRGAFFLYHMWSGLIFPYYCRARQLRIS